MRQSVCSHGHVCGTKKNVKKKEDKMASCICDRGKCVCYPPIHSNNITTTKDQQSGKLQATNRQRYVCVCVYASTHGFMCARVHMLVPMGCAQRVCGQDLAADRDVVAFCKALHHIIRVMRAYADGRMHTICVYAGDARKISIDAECT